ncbi:MAG: hypothetical protein NTV23_03945 [Propionibacteriales bacterium]|nr:hypothetical protein [Propionibacteriales bacterium]
MSPSAVPHGKTALRLEWKFLPKEVRALVEDELGSPVVKAESRNGGFTAGFASVLTGADGSQVFVKAASKVAQAEIAASYSEEIDTVVALGDGVPAPRLDWFSRQESWVLLGFEAVPSRQPRRPWRPPELDRALDLAETIAAATRTIPSGLALVPLVRDLPTLVTGWSAVPTTWPHHDEAAALAARLGTLPADHFVHADLRDDNILFAADGRTLACDWNWPALGTIWQDTVDLLISAHGDGLDAEAVLATRDLTRDVEPDHIDAWLAGVCGYMLAATQRPAPPTSPYLRVHQQWTADAAWSWLTQRRGWRA